MPARILIVEDERLVAKNLELTLESLGYDVIGHVASGEQAVQRAEELAPELVLMDILLEGEMDGIEAAEIIRQQHDIPVVYLSAYADSSSLERVKKTEPYGYLTKPFVPFELHGTIETALYKHKMESRIRESETALLESNDRLEAVFNATTEVMCLLDIEGNCLSLNRPALEVLGKQREEVLGKSFFQLLPGDQGNQRRALFDQVVRSGIPCKFEDTMNERIYECHLYPVFGADDSVAAVAQFAIDMTERILAQNALQANEQMLRSILATSPVGIGFTQSRKIRWVNDAWRNMFGFHNDDEYIGRDAIILYPSRDEYDRVGKLLYTGLEPGTVTEADATLKRADGTVFDANIRISPFDPLDWEKGAISAITDISSRKEMEQDLRVSEERLQLALTGADLGLWDWNVVTGEMVCNERAAEIHGYSLEEMEPLIGEWMALIHPDEKDRVGEEMNAHLDGRTPFYVTEHRRRHKSGEWIWIMCHGRVTERDKEGKPLRVVGTHRDITERKRTEEALRASEEKYRKLTENLPGLVFELDHAARLTYANEAGLEALGYTPEDLTAGIDIFQTVVPEDRERLHASFQRRMAGESQEGLEYNVLRKNGTTFSVITATNPIILGGRVVGIRGVALDISDLKREQEALRAENEGLKRREEARTSQ